MPVTVRPYRPEDAQRITALYNRHADNPNPVAGGITTREFERELADRRTAAFFVAVDGDEVVGTFGLFRVTGRRCARAGELIADMFFIVPSHRNGMLTGQIFAQAVTWMFESHYLVLRLTVNPANKAAFRLYRKVGCVAVGAPRPGEDGNVELYNYIPLILRSVLPGLGEDARAALRTTTSFACLTGDRGEDLRSDVELVDGMRTTSYRLVLGDLLLRASIDVDAAAVIRAELTTGGSTHPLAVFLHRDAGPVPVPGTHRFGTAELTCEVDAADGTVRLVTPGHLGPVLTSTWPSCHPHRLPGWRDTFACDLTVTPLDDGVRIVERHGDTELAGTVTLVDGRLRQEFTSTAPVGRVFHVIGLRQSTFTLRDGRDGTTQQHPAGLGLGVRDSSEIVSAAHRPAPGSELTWTTPDGAVTVGVTTGVTTGLVHSCLLERGPDPDDATRLRLDTHVRVTAVPAVDAVPAAAAGTPVAVPVAGDAEHRVRMSAAAGGVTGWTHGGARVLRSPYPHRRVLVCNPGWSAGMWVTAEPSRTTRDSGVGWGLPSPEAWEPKHPLGIHSPGQRIGWELSLPDRPGDPVTADLHHPDATGDVVLWLTPRTPRAGRVVVPAPRGTTPDGTWTLDADRRWQRWTSHASVELADGSWLTCRPGPDAGPGAEVLVRSTASGLLVGCVTPAESATSTWQFTVTAAPPDGAR